jgi:hypothetical protein
MAAEAREKPRTAWVRPSLDWSTINAVKARLKGSVEQAPSHIDDIELMPMSRQFFAWWMEMRGGKTMPEPDDMNPRGLVELMPYFRMLRWESETSLVVRIFGSALAEAIGMDLTGFCTFGDTDFPGRAEDMARLKLMHAHPCGLLMHRDLNGPDGTPYRCELINLPVSAGPDGGNRIVGTVVTRKPLTESEFDFKLSPPLTLRRAAFIDIGHGLPEAAAGLSA